MLQLLMQSLEQFSSFVAALRVQAIIMMMPCTGMIVKLERLVRTAQAQMKGAMLLDSSIMRDI